MTLSPVRFSALLIRETGRISSTNMPLYDYTLTNSTREYALGDVIREDRRGNRTVAASNHPGIADVARELPRYTRQDLTGWVADRLTALVREHFAGWDLDTELRRKFEKATRTGELLQRTDVEVQGAGDDMQVHYRKPQ